MLVLSPRTCPGRLPLPGPVSPSLVRPPGSHRPVCPPGLAPPRGCSPRPRTSHTSHPLLSEAILITDNRTHSPMSLFRQTHTPLPSLTAQPQALRAEAPGSPLSQFRKVSHSTSLGQLSPFPPPSCLSQAKASQRQERVGSGVPTGSKQGPPSASGSWWTRWSQPDSPSESAFIPQPPELGDRPNARSLQEPDGNKRLSLHLTRELAGPEGIPCLTRPIFKHCQDTYCRTQPDNRISDGLISHVPFPV